MLKIVIMRQDGNLGFSVEHEGIYNDGRKYDGAFGNIGGLKEHVLELIAKIEENEEELVTQLREMVGNRILPPSVRKIAEEELQRWERGRQ